MCSECGTRFASSARLDGTPHKKCGGQIKKVDEYSRTYNFGGKDATV